MVKQEERDGKNIKIKLYIYERLVALKHGNDTFSDVIERLTDGCDLYVREKKPDALNFESDGRETWRDGPMYQTTASEHLNGVLYQFTSRIDKFMTSFYECLTWILTFISMLIWMAVIAFFVLLGILIIVAIITAIFGIDLTPAAEVAAAMK